MPGSLLSRYSPLPGASVPFCCVTRYCSGESLEMASGSLLNFLISFSSCQTCMEETSRVRAALKVEAAARLCSRAKTEKSLEFQDTAGLPKIPASLVLSLRVRDHQLLIRRIDDEHGEQPRRLGVTGVLAHPMIGAGLLEPRFTGPVDADRLVIDLAPDLAREYVGVDESRAGVTVRGRSRPRGVVDDVGDQALPGQVRDGLVRGDSDGFPERRAVRASGRMRGGTIGALDFLLLRPRHVQRQTASDDQHR